MRYKTWLGESGARIERKLFKMSEISTQIVLDAIIKGILSEGVGLFLDGSLVDEIGDFVDSNNIEVISPEDILSSLSQANKLQGMNALLDFGCGTAAYRNMIETLGYKWHGINYLNAMAKGTRKDASRNNDISFYDGIKLPYDDKVFHVVYSNQVFEHCSDIHANFREIQRVLKPGGSLVGSVSYLEQMHDYSTFNCTPLGIKTACDASGLKLVKLYPSYDIFTWMVRRLIITTMGTDTNSLSKTLLRDNNISSHMNTYCKRVGSTVKENNLFRLMFSAHITFHIDNPYT